jgi:hypothetical protein
MIQIVSVRSPASQEGLGLGTSAHVHVHDFCGATLVCQIQDRATGNPGYSYIGSTASVGGSGNEDGSYDGRTRASERL